MFSFVHTVHRAQRCAALLFFVGSQQPLSCRPTVPFPFALCPVRPYPRPPFGPAHMETRSRGRGTLHPPPPPLSPSLHCRRSVPPRRCEGQPQRHQPLAESRFHLPLISTLLFIACAITNAAPLPGSVCQSQSAVKDAPQSDQPSSADHSSLLCALSFLRTPSLLTVLSFCLCLLFFTVSDESSWRVGLIPCTAPPSSANLEVRIPPSSRTLKLMQIARADATEIPTLTLETLSFQAVCRPGFGPASGKVGDAGLQSWSCRRTRQHGADVFVWRPISADPEKPEAALTCAPCPAGHLCAGPAVNGEIIPCPRATFAAAGSDRCHDCPSCCSPCDPMGGGCLASSTPGCKIGGVCWPKGAPDPLSEGCRSCEPAVNRTAW